MQNTCSFMVVFTCYDCIINSLLYKDVVNTVCVVLCNSHVVQVEQTSTNNYFPGEASRDFEFHKKKRPASVTSKITTAPVALQSNTQLTALYASPRSTMAAEAKAYKLEDFVNEFPLPQLVSVTEGHYGLTEDFSMSEGTELILFFKKKTQAVVAMKECVTDPYYIPLNCSLQFSPYQRHCAEHSTKSYYYETVEDLIQRNHDLPKVVKVLKSYKGSKYYMVQGELIFPKRISGQSKRRVLEYMNGSKECMKAKLSCAAGFSTNPSDTKMYLVEYVENINEFPSSVVVFCDQERNEALSHIYTGTEFILQECKTLHSCICSTDVHGELGYPLLEILTAMPIEVRVIECSKFSMESIYDKVKNVYEFFDLSMITNSMFLGQDDESHFYDEIKRKHDGSNLHIYDLERPEVIYSTPRLRDDSKRHKQTLVLSQFQGSFASSITPIITSAPPTSHRRTPIYELFQKTWPRRKPKNAATLTPQCSYVQSDSPPTTPDENRTYLRYLSVTDVLQALDKLNLGQYKETFQQNQVNGRTLLSFTTVDLEELGVMNHLHQKLLLDLVSGIETYRA